MALRSYANDSCVTHYSVADSISWDVLIEFLLCTSQKPDRALSFDSSGVHKCPSASIVIDKNGKDAWEPRALARAKRADPLR